MEIKFFEVRDSATCIPVMCTKLEGDNQAQRAILRRAGFLIAIPCILYVHLQSSRSNWDIYAWSDRTNHTAHNFIKVYWDSLTDGEVIDVEYILGETKVKKTSEIIFDTQPQSGEGEE